MNKIHEIHVGGDASYSIHVGPGLLDDGAALATHVRGRHVLLVSDGNVAPLYAARVVAALAAHTRAQVLVSSIAPGEGSKTLASFAELSRELADFGATRDACVFALGGGVVDWLEANAEALLARNDEALAEAIARSCAHKAAIVARDPREHGERALLNFGHTFAHAIEAEQGYAGGDGGLNHGEAVAVGMVLAARLSAALGMAGDADAQRLALLLQRLGLDTGLPAGLDPRALLARMRLDKKADASGLRFILWSGIGNALIAPGVPESAVLDVLQ